MKSIVLMLMVIAGCSGNSAAPVPAPVTITAGQVFNAAMIGQTWTFQNGYGDVSTIDIQAAAFCEAGICDGKSVVMHFAKTVCVHTGNRAYAERNCGLSFTLKPMDHIGLSPAK
jgi:hypothetical protein